MNTKLQQIDVLKGQVQSLNNQNQLDKEEHYEKQKSLQIKIQALEHQNEQKSSTINMLKTVERDIKQQSPKHLPKPSSSPQNEGISHLQFKQQKPVVHYDDEIFEPKQKFKTIILTSNQSKTETEAPQVVEKIVIKEVPIEIIKEVPVEIIKEVKVIDEEKSDNMQLSAQMLAITEEKESYE